MTKEKLIDVYRETIQVCQDGEYKGPTGELVYLGTCNGQFGWVRPGVASQGMNFAGSSEGEKDGSVSTEFDVLNMDTVYAGEQLLKDGYNPAVLNMASQWRPGGGVERGTTAQEESLFRRSDLCMTLDPLKNFYYPFRYDDLAIYCGGTKFFRGLEADGCPFLEKPIQLSVITVPAYKLERYQRENLPGNWNQRMTAKVMKILDVALEFGHDAIVLGAFGCGAYNNPNRKVAELFKRILSDGVYANRFRKVVFAVMDNHPEDPHGNYAVFSEVFAK